MHRIPKIFPHSPNRRKASASYGRGAGLGSGHGAGNPKRRLQRLNARKNINYEPSPSSASASSSSSSSSSYSPDESPRTSLIDPYSCKASFRVDGSYAEIEFLCRSLGFTGIDDLAIPAEEYEAMKLNSSYATLGFSKKIEHLIHRKSDVNKNNVSELPGYGDGITGSIRVEIEGDDVSVGLGEDNDLINRKCRECLDFGNMDRDETNLVGSQVVDSSRSDAVLSDHVNGRVYEHHGNGIKGVRPSVLIPPALDKDCLSWDLYETSVPPNVTRTSMLEYGFCLDEIGEPKRSEDEDNEEHKRRRVKAGEESCLLSGSCSFSTISRDDDSSSTATDPFSSVSSDGRFGRVIVEWQKGELLGRGSFGSVYEGISDNGFFFAVKEVYLLDQRDEGKQRIIQLEQEIALLSQFKHENIVQYYGTKKDGSHLYIFLELVTKGSLLCLYQKYNLRDSQVSAYTRQILHGLKYLHDRNVVHRDIKCANILVDTNGLVKLADFGLAKATKLNDVNSCKGTAFWMAPEVVRCLGYGLAADIWSLGCTVLELLTRRFPYHNLECTAALFRIGMGERPPIPDSLSSDARDFVLKCLQVNPSSRPSAEQLLDHPFVKQPLLPSSSFASPRYLAGIVERHTYYPRTPTLCRSSSSAEAL